jgi:glycolate oxidase FAD binding subunit
LSFAQRAESRGQRAELVGALQEAASAGRSVRFRGGGTKLNWGLAPEPDVELSTAGLDRIVEHNVGDLTAVLQPCVPLARAQEVFAEEGQMLSLDPPDGGATVGGIVAAGDSGPLRSRYGAARDLVLGMTVALSDGTVARSGGNVIKNVAGYDLAKLFSGSLGTLGAILELSVRLHPLPRATASAAAGSNDPGELGRAALALSHSPLEHMGLDLRYGGGDGALLMRFGGAEARKQAEAAVRALEETGVDGSVVEEDAEAWERQRLGQRSLDGMVVRVSAVQTELPNVMRAADGVGARLVARVPLGLCWLSLDERSPEEAIDAVERLRAELSPHACAVLDAPDSLRGKIDSWGPRAPGTVELMRRVKERFDPAGVCNPGALF